jgi:hypothetical protein
MKRGRVTNIRFTLDGLGNQYTLIDGTVFATWFDLLETPVRIGSEVEYETGTDRAFRCPTAKILRVIAPGEVKP